jgi:hypothetical protein
MWKIHDNGIGVENLDLSLILYLHIDFEYQKRGYIPLPGTPVDKLQFLLSRLNGSKMKGHMTRRTQKLVGWLEVNLPYLEENRPIHLHHFPTVTGAGISFQVDIQKTPDIQNEQIPGVFLRHYQWLIFLPRTGSQSDSQQKPEQEPCNEAGHVITPFTRKPNHIPAYSIAPGRKKSRVIFIILILLTAAAT